MFQPVDPKKNFPELEREILDFWEKDKIFEKSVVQRKGAKKFVFFDGPPFANGLPHYGHILANAIKDAVTRYFTMKGYYVPRVNGWDCHGLPVEYEIEKELKLSGKKDIEKMGMAKFNAVCRESVFRYTEEWEKLLKRIGRFVDFDHSYATLENEYMESIWWIFKEIWKKGMIYQGYKSMHICPRCETPLSNFEVTLGYKEVTDPSVYVKFTLAPRTYLLAWTTTPWTLPGNVALALGPKIEYVKVKSGADYYILARQRLSSVFADTSHEVIEKLTSKDLVGKTYEPLFPFYKGRLKEKAYVVVMGDFVSTEDGTGIVHIAPAFGEDDYELAKKYNLPVLQHVAFDGTFKPEVTPWAGKFVKSQDLNIKDSLEKEGKLFRFENFRHTYPHCWRCDTPLLNYATKAWFIRVTDIKNKLIENNQKIHWQPTHVKDGRFGKWLEGARDWNISRNRYWGCPIPLWECPNGHQSCLGSLKELREQSLGGNTFYVIRHGEAEQNGKGMLNSDPEKAYHLTPEGKKQVEKVSDQLKQERITMIFSSPFPRAMESTEIIAKKIGVTPEIDGRLREHDLGIFDGKKVTEYVRSFADMQERYTKKIPGGESFEEMEKRVIEFINYLNRKYEGKGIAIVTHGDVVRGIARYFERYSIEETFQFKPSLAGVYIYRAGKLPLRDSKLDLHKPYIDEILLECEECKKPMKRIPEVLDCWFESGAMPYAQLHYPFEKKQEFEENFPAEFIGEGVDQTRGWFYTLHVLATILFNKPAFKNVIVNGILLAANGEKLSKRKKNYPDPNKLFETLGVDATRFFLYTSTAPLAEDVRFSDKHVEDMVKQFFLPLWNVYSFFVTYANIDRWTPAKIISGTKKTLPRHKLDRWILSELHGLIAEVTDHLDDYNLTRATRPFVAFVDQLSNWYIRRSRRRFWKSENDKDKEEAYETLFTVLNELSKLLAPFAPFVSDFMYRNLTGKESVHLEDWPKSNKTFIQSTLNQEVALIRNIVALGHAVRAKKDLKVRQPLSLAQIWLPHKTDKKIVEAYRDVIADELNVKNLKVASEVSDIASLVCKPRPQVLGPKYGKEVQEIIQLAKEGNFHVKNNVVEVGKYNLSLEEVDLGYRGKQGFDVESAEGFVVSLDTTVTKELAEEGIAREIVRHIQDMRKESGYRVSDRIYVAVETNAPLRETITRFADYIERETLAIELQQGGEFEWDTEKEITLNGMKVKLAVRK